jgi:hypothetical protein
MTHEQAVQRLQAVREIWADRRFAKLSPDAQRTYLVAKATQGSAFTLSHDDYIAQQALYSQAALEVVK